MKRNFYIGIGLVVILIAALLSYGIYLNQKSENQIVERMNERRLQLRGAVVAVRTIYPVVYPDVIRFYSNQMVDVTALIEGKINKIFVEPHTLVNAGDPLIELFNEEILLQIKQVDSDILEAEANLTRAQNTYNRYLQLIEMDAISRQKFDEAEADLKSAVARLENYRAKREQFLLRQTRQIIPSPIRGEILKFYKPVGSYILAGTPVALIGDFDTLYFDRELINEPLFPIAVGDTSKINFSGEEDFEKSYGTRYYFGNKGSSQIFTARLIEISPPINQPAEIRKLVWEIDNSVGMLEPGLYSNAKMTSDKPVTCLTIPLKSNFLDKDNFVYVAEDGILKRRKIVSGVSDENFLEVVSGLNEGDIVITSNTDGLTEGLNVEIILDEEAH